MTTGRTTTTGRKITTGRRTSVLRLAAPALTAALIAASLGGCSDQRFERAQAKRQKRIERLFFILDRREGRSPDNTADIYARIRDAEASNSASLMKSFDWLQSRYHQELELWPERLSETQQRFDKEMQGDLPNIDETIPRMFY